MKAGSSGVHVTPFSGGVDRGTRWAQGTHPVAHVGRPFFVFCRLARHLEGPMRCVVVVSLLLVLWCGWSCFAATPCSPPPPPHTHSKQRSLYTHPFLTHTLSLHTQVWDMGSGQCTQTILNAHQGIVMSMLQWEVRTTSQSCSHTDCTLLLATHLAALLVD